jgi:hypothetical protein
MFGNVERIIGSLVFWKGGLKRGCLRMLQVGPGRFSSTGTAFEIDGCHELGLRETEIAVASSFLASRKQKHYKLFK